jgi:hypothetical protein
VTHVTKRCDQQTTAERLGQASLTARCRHVPLAVGELQLRPVPHRAQGLLSIGNQALTAVEHVLHDVALLAAAAATYSHRRASIGSMDAVRRAGSHAAPIMAIASVLNAAAIESASSALTLSACSRGSVPRSEQKHGPAGTESARSRRRLCGIASRKPFVDHAARCAATLLFRNRS